MSGCQLAPNLRTLRRSASRAGLPPVIAVTSTVWPVVKSKIRVFGPKFAGSFDEDYASMHLAVDGKKEAQRVVGAVLSSLAPYIKHPTPDLEPLIGAA